ncbi:MAG: DNA-binding response regulator [Syntrophobacteraceae bacterium CG2_30_61_12]|nr:MAG: DNA-binding response regulator [Syntrophobacteraceae bacterium CG2_30_61_12]
MKPILVIDDDVELCELLAEYLIAEGLRMEAVHDGSLGAERALSGDYQLVILDVMLPGLGGFDVLRRIRAAGDIPVIMLTARGDDVDRIVGLELGADDYLAKPFNPRELTARVRAILRRTMPQQTLVGGREIAPKVVVGDVELDPATRTVRCSGEIVSLTSVEYSVLEVLLREAGRVVSREELTELALGRPLARYDRSIDVHVSNLRRKLGREAEGLLRIKAVRGVGYLYAAPRADDEQARET